MMLQFESTDFNKSSILTLATHPHSKLTLESLSLESLRAYCVWFGLPKSKLPLVKSPLIKTLKKHMEFIRKDDELLFKENGLDELNSLEIRLAAEARGM